MNLTRLIDSRGSEKGSTIHDRYRQIKALQTRMASLTEGYNGVEDILGRR